MDCNKKSKKIVALSNGKQYGTLLMVMSSKIGILSSYMSALKQTTPGFTSLALDQKLDLRSIKTTETCYV